MLFYQLISYNFFFFNFVVNRYDPDRARSSEISHRPYRSKMGSSTGALHPGRLWLRLQAQRFASFWMSRRQLLLSAESINNCGTSLSTKLIQV